MRTETKEIKVYNFEDLKTNSELKSKVLENLAHINVEHIEWWYYDKHIEKLESMGFSEVDISFSGFWSQGDGASFTAKSFDAKKFIQDKPEYRRLLKLIDGGYISLSGKVKRDRNTHYVHENTTTFYLDADVYGNMGTRATNVCNLISSLEEHIQNCLISLNKEIYADIEAQYEYETSEQAILETIEANEYEFTEDGQIY